MPNARINIIAAIGKNNRAIGKAGALLWRIGDDLKRFKTLTTGHTVIMGRKTFDSIGKPLPNRTNIVITRNSNFKPDGVVVAKSLEEAIRLAQTLAHGNNKNQEIFIIGGGEIYAQAIPLCEKLLLTEVESDAEGDAFFPDYAAAGFTREVSREERIDEKTGLRYAWVDLERQKDNTAVDEN